MRIMGMLMPRPSVVNEEFNGRMGVNEPRAATDWFYGLCCDAGGDRIQFERIQNAWQQYRQQNGAQA